MTVSPAHLFFFQGLWSSIATILLYRVFISTFGYDLLQIQCLTIALLTALLIGVLLPSNRLKLSTEGRLQPRWLGWFGWMGILCVALAMPFLPTLTVMLDLKQWLSYLWPIRIVEILLLVLLLIFPVSMLMLNCLQAIKRSSMQQTTAAGLHWYGLAATIAIPLSYGVILPYWQPNGLMVALLAGVTSTTFFPLGKPQPETAQIHPLPTQDETYWQQLLFVGNLGFALFAQVFLWQRVLQVALGPFPWLGIVISTLALLGITMGITFQQQRTMGNRSLAILQADNWLWLAVVGLFDLLMYPYLASWIGLTLGIEQATLSNWTSLLFALLTMMVLPAATLLGQAMVTAWAYRSKAIRAERMVQLNMALFFGGGLLACSSFPLLLAYEVSLQQLWQGMIMSQALVALLLIGNMYHVFTKWRLFLSTSLAVSLLVATGIGATWDRSTWTYGLYQPSIAKLREHDEPMPQATSYQHQDGVFATIAMEAQADAYWRKRNGWITPTNQLGFDSSNMIGLISFLFAPHAGSVAQISWGDFAPIPLFEHRSATQIALVVPEPALFTASSGQEPGVVPVEYNDMQVQHFISQPQLFFAFQQERYDSILVQLPPAWTDDAMELHQDHFWQTVSASLTEQGVVVVWLPGGESNATFFQQQLCALQANFPQNLVFAADMETSDAIFVGSQQQLSQAWQTWLQRSQQISPHLATYGISNMASLIARLRIDTTMLKSTCANLPATGIASFATHVQWLDTLLELAKSLPTLHLLEPAGQQTIDVAKRLIQATGAPDLLQLLDGYLEQGMLEEVKLILQAYQPEERDKRDMTPNFVVWQERLQLLALLESAQDNESTSVSAFFTEDEELLLLQEDFVKQNFTNIATFFEKRPNFTRRHGRRQLIYGYSLYRLGFVEQAEIALQQAMYSTEDPSLLRPMYYFHAKSAFRAGNLRTAIQSILAYLVQVESPSDGQPALQQPIDQE